MQTPEPQAAITPAAMSELLSNQQKMHESLAQGERLRASARLRAAVDEAKLHTAEVMRRHAHEVHAKGAFPVTLLSNDPYRDTRATLAEARTNSFALKLTLDAVEYTYDVDGYVQGRYTKRRLSRHFDDIAEARAFFTDACGRFFCIADFRTLVDF